MKKIPLILTLVCTTLTGNYKTQAAEANSNSFTSSADHPSFPTERVVVDTTPSGVSQLELAASISWDEENERQSRLPTKAGVSSEKKDGLPKAGVPDDENEILQRFLLESITNASSPKSSSPFEGLLNEEAERLYQRDLKEVVEATSAEKSKSPHLYSPISSGSKERTSSSLASSSDNVHTSPPRRANVVAKEEDDGLQDALRQIAELEKKEAAEEKHRKEQEEREAAEKERKLAEEKRLRHKNELETIKKQLDEVRQRKSALELQLKEIEQLEDGLSSIYLNLLAQPKNEKTSAFELPTSIKPGSASSFEGESSVGSSNGSSMTPLPSAAIPRSSGTPSESHSSDLSEKK